jgi:hypothetical protein
MGGTGNTGQTPEKQAGVQDAITASGNASLPQWGAGAAAPGTVAGQQGLPALTEAPPSLRPYEEATASTGAGAGPQTGLLAPQGAGNAGGGTIAGPMGFQSDPYPTQAAPVDTFAAPAPVAPAAPEVPKEFAAPTSFANPWDAMIGANAKVAGRAPFYSGDWSSNPDAVQQWLQAYADAGGDYRVQDKYYNTVSPGAGQKIYWPGDPARK